MLKEIIIDETAKYFDPNYNETNAYLNFWVQFRSSLAI